MKKILMGATVLIAFTGAAYALSADLTHVTKCEPGAGLGNDLTCSIYVQAEFFGKAAATAGYDGNGADFRDAPEVRQSDLIGDTFLSDDGVIVIGVDGSQSDLYNLYLRWMDRNGFVSDADVSAQIANGDAFVAPPLGFDFDGSILGAI